MSKSYEELTRRLREIALLQSVSSLLSWDQETMMPSRGANVRAEELALVARLAHEQATDPRVGDLLAACEADRELHADERIAANLRELRRNFDRAVCLPSSLVAEMNETASRGLEAWRQARADSDFEAFRPFLEKQLELCRRKAECYGTPDGGESYDALLQDFEPDMTAAELERIFGPLRMELTGLIEALVASPRSDDSRLDQVRLSIEQQKQFNVDVLGALGFDLDAGRLDISTHPFSTGVAPGDTRLTTRYKEDQFLDGLGSTMHEAGHALYEQGLPHGDLYGQPLSDPVSLGIHESQSRLWENQVGRSREFWQWATPRVRAAFGAAVQGIEVEDFYRAANRVHPGLIRVESDEATYNLHIMLRFDLERALLRGDLAVADLPAEWNRRMKQDLGVDVPDDAHGCLQDIHWSMGSIGYFPTYTLGNLYSAQLWEAIGRELPELPASIAAGEFSELLAWLRTHVHAHGQRYTAAQLCRHVTGKALSHEPLLRHLESKLGAIYGLKRGTGKT